MNITKIKHLKNQAIKEAQEEVDKIFKKYCKLINEEIALQIPKGQTLVSCDGLCQIVDKNGDDVAFNSTCKSVRKYNEQMNFLADLQYPTNNRELFGVISLRCKIAGKK